MFPGSERVQIFQIQRYRHKKSVKLIKLHLKIYLPFVGNNKFLLLKLAILDYVVSL